jgi:hypothetical protein
MELILSAGGKEVLIKSVVQSVPVFSMSCFKLTRGLCEHLNSMIRKFWWGSKDGNFIEKKVKMERGNLLGCHGM